MPVEDWLDDRAARAKRHVCFPRRRPGSRVRLATALLHRCRRLRRNDMRSYTDA